MNLVCQNQNAVSAADVKHLLQLLLGPHAAYRVVRGTEDKHGYLILFNSLLKLLEIQLKMSVVVIQVAGYKLSACV